MVAEVGCRELTLYWGEAMTEPRDRSESEEHAESNDHLFNPVPDGSDKSDRCLNGLIARDFLYPVVGGGQFLLFRGTQVSYLDRT